MESSGSEAGEASSSPGTARMAACRRPVHRSSGQPLVRLPQDRLEVEWWLVRHAIETGEEIPYTRQGVFDLWPGRRAQTERWTFGLEFEFGSADTRWVAAELHARGLCASAEPGTYHGDRAEGFWAVEQDRSVSAIFACDRGGPPIVVGGEVISPPLHDSPIAWDQVAVVLDVLRACGAQVNQQCGLHVHMGASAFRDATGTTSGEPERAILPALSRLAILAGVCFEDLIFRMASAEGGRHRGQAVYYRHCRPLERPLPPASGSLAELTLALGRPGAERHAALNLTNIGDPQKDTVEFRQCNGTLDGRVVQAFCRLCAALVGAACWYPEAARLAPEPLGTHLACALAPREAEGRETESERAAVPLPDPVDDAASLWRFLAAICPEGLPVEAAASLLWLFRRGRWQPSLATLARAPLCT